MKPRFWQSCRKKSNRTAVENIDHLTAGRGMLATNFRRDKQKGLTVNKVKLIIKHQKRPFAEWSRSDASCPLRLRSANGLTLSCPALSR